MISGGLAAVISSTRYMLRESGLKRGLRVLGAVNQQHGFDCPSCAWPDPKKPSTAEFCEKHKRFSFAYNDTTENYEIASRQFVEIKQQLLNSLTNHGPHGLTEVIYAYSSATGNNGSAFAGLSANTPFLNTTLGIAMLWGRFLMIIPLLAAAGSLAQKKLVPVSTGTFPTHGPLFVVLLVGVVVIVGALTFFPALSLGPIVEHFLMHQGRLWS